MKKIHFLLLRVIAGFLTGILCLLPVSGIWAVNRMMEFHIFRNFNGYIKEPSAIVSLVLFLFLYFAMVWVQFLLCIICKRLHVIKRAITLVLLWIPFLNYGLAFFMLGLAKEELDHSRYKIQLDDVQIEKQICKTRYPILLVHGIGFRDYRYFNYWGRIPKELVRNGAKVYYGHPEAWGTIETNGEILRDKIFQIIQETNCEKVNIIAHSKGGLDSRYLISKLSMASCVASLTTINTPHRGSMLVDLLKRLPDSFYRKVCERIDHYFTILGDERPDSFHASTQLSCSFAKEFNKQCPDMPGVYYQSYTSLMRNSFSSFLLGIPYFFLKILDGENDGLVTEESAKWTNFRGTIKNPYLRGVSHADMVDLSREDFKGFDVLEFYVQLIRELKEKGF